MCHKEGHLKKDCPERRSKSQEKGKDSGDTAVVEDGYKSAEILSISESDSNKEWILDSGCSYHMCLNKC